MNSLREGEWQRKAVCLVFFCFLTSWIILSESTDTREVDSCKFPPSCKLVNSEIHCYGQEEVKLTTPAVRYEGAEVQNVTYDTKTSFMLQDEDLQP